MYELLTPELALPSTELHVVFSAECIPAFDWQSVGLFYSFYRCRQPGKITRLLACSDEQLAAYPKTNMDIGPTFVHKNMRFDAVNDVERGDPFHDDKAGHGYASYNKPYSVMAWLEAVTVEEDYVLMMDTDMLLRAPLDPVAYGVERGTVVSAKYSYLYGTESGFARHFIDESLHERLVGVGGFHIFHRDDLRQIAPLWLEYTKKVRAFANTHPDEYFNESFRLPSPPQAGSAGPSDEEVAVQHKQARWHGEMYGYVFAAALVGVTHHVRQDVMMYPGNVPFLARPPIILHYGSDYTIGKAYFNKMSHQDLRLETCPGFLFDDPGFTKPVEELSKQDALSIENLATLNAAFCAFYARVGCEPLPERCGGAGAPAFAAALDALQPVIARCRDEEQMCSQWARMGECQKNPLFMKASCAVTCKSCDTPVDEVLAGTEDQNAGDWKALRRLKRGKLKQDALAYVASADEAELHELADAIEQRREVLTSKFEL